MNSQITLCLTIGRRPELLEKTLRSLLPLFEFTEIIAINDFRDPPTNEAFRRVCPNGKLISLSAQVGHHAAVDCMYRQVSTPYVMHCEDDWEFTNPLDVAGAISLLRQKPEISQVCFRKVSDFHLSEEDLGKIDRGPMGDLKYARLDKIHPQWHGYTFNPHLASLELWRQLNGFSGFKKERHISRALRAKGRFTAYIEPGSCSHIGLDQSVSASAANPTGLNLFKKKLKSLFHRG